MQNKLKRLSYNQLLILKVFLGAGGRIVTSNQLEKKTRLRGKSLGGVLSALSRTRFREISLIEPVGKARQGTGLRWLLNERLLKAKQAKNEVNKLLKTYE